MAPPAVFALPFFKLYSAIGLFDTPWAVALAHCLFNIPLAVWILEGFMSGVPREIDETAAIDGYSFPRFFVRIFMPLIAGGIGVAAFFCFMFSWVELLLARTLTSVNAKPIAATMTRTVSAAGMDWGLLAAAGVLTIIPGALVIWFVRNYIAQAASRWAGSEGGAMDLSPGWPGPGRRPLFFAFFALLAAMTVLAARRPEVERIGILGMPTTRGDRLFLSLLGAAFIHLGWLGAGGEAPLWGASILSLIYARGDVPLGLTEGARHGAPTTKEENANDDMTPWAGAGCARQRRRAGCPGDIFACRAGAVAPRRGRPPAAGSTASSSPRR